MSLWKKVTVLCVILSAAGLVLSNSPLTVGQEKKAEKTQKAEKTEKKAKGRLPAYYADVVSDEQKEKIYAIQAKYDTQVKDLNAQLAALAKKINDEIDTLLTDEQKEKVKAARDKAVEAKKKKTADKKAKEAKGESAAKAN